MKAFKVGDLVVIKNTGVGSCFDCMKDMYTFKIKKVNSHSLNKEEYILAKVLRKPKTSE